MEFDIDVSGEDLLSKNYTICIANTCGLISGYKISSDFVRSINSKYGQGLYRYTKSKKGKSILKIRVYCTIIYLLFKKLNLKGEVKLNICKDFYGKDKEIESNLKYFLEELLGLKIIIRFARLDKNSLAHRYAYLMRNDTKNKLKTYSKISLEDIESFLRNTKGRY